MGFSMFFNVYALYFGKSKNCFLSKIDRWIKKKVIFPQDIHIGRYDVILDQIWPNLGKFSKLNNIRCMLVIYSWKSSIRGLKNNGIVKLYDFQKFGPKWRQVLLHLWDLPKLTQIWSTMTSFGPKCLKVIKCSDYDCFRDPKVALGVNCQERTTNITRFMRFTQISPNLVQNDIHTLKNYGNIYWISNLGLTWRHIGNLSLRLRWAGKFANFDKP